MILIVSWGKDYLTDHNYFIGDRSLLLYSDILSYHQSNYVECHNYFCFLFLRLHDRKLCVLGICTLLEMGAQRPNLDEVIPKIMPSCLTLFEGLKRAYELKAEGDDDTSTEEEEEDEDEGITLLVPTPVHDSTFHR